MKEENIRTIFVNAVKEWMGRILWQNLKWRKKYEEKICECCKRVNRKEKENIEIS